MTKSVIPSALIAHLEKLAGRQFADLDETAPSNAWYHNGLAEGETMLAWSILIQLRNAELIPAE